MKRVKKFLENINSHDSVLIIHHNDLDGIASGVLLYDSCIKKTKKISHVSFNHGEKFKFNKYRDFDKIIFVDLADNVVIDIIQFYLKQKKEILFIDHHQKNITLPKEVLVYYNKKEKYIPCSRMVQEIVKDKLWLGVVGTVSDYGFKYKENDSYINSFLKKEKIEFDFFFKTIVFTLSNSIVYFNKNINKIFEIIQKLNNYQDTDKLQSYSEKVEIEFKKLSNTYLKKQKKLGEINYFFVKSKYPLRGTLISKLSLENPREVLIFAGKKSFFSNLIYLSSRTGRDDINLRDILKEGVKGFKNSSCGGHKKASGADFHKKYLNEFKKRLYKIKI